MTLVELQQVEKTYHLGVSRIPALQAVNLTIERGAFAAVWGPSGSGKSTLCNLVGTLDVPTSGRVIIAGEDVSRLGDDARADFRNRTLGFIFQTFNLIPVLSALENVMLPVQIPGTPASRAREAAAGWLERLGLQNLFHHRPDQLSGGQRQRVAIARALVTAPSLVVADEPTANLDSDTALELIDLLRAINREQETTFLISTHDQRLLGRVDRRILLRDGRIVEDTREPAGETAP
jgi:putative ABC transport system ATP-binding protein